MARMGRQVAFQMDPSAEIVWHSQLADVRRLSSSQQVESCCRCMLCTVLAKASGVCLHLLCACNQAAAAVDAVLLQLNVLGFPCCTSLTKTAYLLGLR